MINPPKAHIYLSLSVLFWSTVATAFKLALGKFDFIQTLFIASLSSLICLTIILIIERKLVLLLQATKKDFRRSALMGLLNPTLYYLVLFKAYSVLPAQEAQPLNWTWPIVLSLMSALFLKQTLKLKHFLALGVSFIGVLVISTKGSFQAKMLTNFAGDLLALFSSLIWASYWIANLKDERVAEVKLWLNFAFGTIYGFPVILLFSRFPCFNPQGVLASIYIGIFEMGITFILWLKGLSLSKNSAQAGLIAYFSPFFSLIFIHSVLGETILWSSFAGLVLIITGVFLQRK